MSTNYYLVENRPSINGVLHIGKSSFGWRFLFHKPSIWDAPVPLNTFEQWRNYLTETTKSGSYVIMNEYNKQVSLESFLKLVQEKQKINRKDMFEDCENINGYRFASGNFY